MPQPDDMVMCPPTPEELGLPSATLGDVIELVSELPFELAMLALSRLAAELHHHPHDRDYHLLLAAELYRGQVWPRFEAFVRSSPTHLGFDPRHVAALQRLVVLHAASDPPTDRSLTAAEIRRLGGALLGVASALPGGEPPARDPETAEDWAAWARYTTLIGAWHHEPDTVEAFARAHSWYVDVHGDPEFTPKAKQRCDVDAWMLETYGLTVGEQLAGGLACAAITLALDSDATWQQRLRHIEPGFLRHSALADKETKLFELIAASRDELAELIEKPKDDPARIAWDHTVFEQRPLLRAADGRLLLMSPRGLLSWMTRGIHQRALAAAQKRPHPKKKDETMARIYLGYAPLLGEESVRRLIRRSLETQVRSGIVRVHGEHDYKIGKEPRRSPDAMLDYGADIVAVEIFSGRISREARSTLDETLLRQALDRATTDKLNELADRLRELLAGELIYPDHDLAATRRIWPVLVLAGDPILQTPALWHYLRHTAPEAFIDDPRVRRPTIANLDDLEPLLALVQEEGFLLPELLRDIMASPFSQLPPRNWLHATFGGIKRPARYVEEQASAAVRLAGRLHFPDSKRLAEFGLGSAD
jgi:hypothetical protein